MHRWHFDQTAFEGLLERNVMLSPDIFSLAPSLCFFYHTDFDYKGAVLAFVRVQSIMSKQIEHYLLLILYASVKSDCDSLLTLYNAATLACRAR